MKEWKIILLLVIVSVVLYFIVKWMKGVVFTGIMYFIELSILGTFFVETPSDPVQDAYRKINTLLAMSIYHIVCHCFRNGKWSWIPCVPILLAAQCSIFLCLFVQYSTLIPWIEFEESEFYMCMRNPQIEGNRFEQCFFGRADAYGHIMLMYLSFFWFVVRRDFEISSNQNTNAGVIVPVTDGSMQDCEYQNDECSCEYDDATECCGSVNIKQKNETFFRQSYTLRNRQVMSVVHP